MSENDEGRARILLVEDEDLLRHSVQRYLDGKGLHVTAAKEGLQGLRKIRSGDFDLLVTDLHLDGVDGLELTAAARKHNPHLQVIIISGHGSKETVIRALRQGVWDFVEKPFDLELLLITIEKALEKSRMEKELVRLSRTDGLTGLFNQRYFYAVLEAEMKRASRQNRPLSLILLDVDEFKKYNDLHGHLAGDDMLMRLASCIRRACRKDVDVGFRYGGDEFVILLPEADRRTAEEVSRRVCHVVEEEGLELTLSIGVTELSRGRDLKGAVREADEAMYLAKQFGGNRTVTFEHSG